MRALATAIQDARADLHLSVDELAERCDLPVDDLWRLLSDGPACLVRPEPTTLNRLAAGLRQPAELLHRAARVDVERV
jgi:transcriptional regulator with XRE-family HTH domain